MSGSALSNDPKYRIILVCGAYLHHVLVHYHAACATSGELTHAHTPSEPLTFSRIAPRAAQNQFDSGRQEV